MKKTLPRWLLLGVFAWLATGVALAQAPDPPGYEKPNAGALENALATIEIMDESQRTDTQEAMGKIAAALPPDAEPALQARVLLAQAWPLMATGKLGEAMALAQKAHHLAVESGHLRMQAEALSFTGEVLFEDGKYEEALAKFQQELALVEPIGLPMAQGLAWNRIGIAYRRLARLEEAVDAYEKSLHFNRMGDDRRQVAQTLNNLGVAYNSLGDHAKALALYSESLAIKRELRMESDIPDSLFNIAVVYSKLGDQEQALANFEESYRHDEKSGHVRNMALGMQFIADVEFKLGRIDAAFEHASRSVALFEQVGSGRTSASALAMLAQVELARGNMDAARAPLLRALDISKESSDRQIIVRASELLARVEKATSHLDNAITLAESARTIAEEASFKSDLPQIHGLLSELYEASGDTPRALAAQRAQSKAAAAQLDEQQLRQLGNLRRGIDIQQREHEIENLRRASEEQAHRNERDALTRNFRLALGLGAVGLLFLLAWGYWHRRQLAGQQRVNQSLKRLDALKDDFLANTSHELRTPLLGIMGLAENLRDGGSGTMSEKAKHELELIVASGSRLSTLVDDILDFARIKRGQLELELRPVDLRVAGDVVLALAAPLAAGRALQLSNQIADDGRIVLADEDRLQQILHNLIGNAIKFTERGSITLRARREGERVVVEVADTGIGISPERKNAIFEPFEQADGSIARTYGGTGLGLAVTRQLVELQGGHITVESTPGKGSVFRFDLAHSTQAPIASVARLRRTVLQAEAIAPDITPNPETPASPTRPDGELFRVLVVDDEPVNRKVLTNYLTGRYHVREAADGAQALALLKEEPADLLLLDIMMPGVSGYEVCRELRERLPFNELPVILLTASHRLGDLLQGFELGANDFLTKPISKAELLSRVDTHLRLLDISRNLERRVAERTAELQHATDLLRRASETDFLTGLPNRRGLLHHLPQGQADTNRAVLLLDLDNFTKVNDVYGHQHGDVVLRGVAEVLRRLHRTGDLISRWGGEEFLALLPETDTTTALALAEHIRAELSTQRFEFNGVTISVTTTIGVAMATSDTDFEKEVRRADHALYQGKATGKNRVCLADEETAMPAPTV